MKHTYVRPEVEKRLREMKKNLPHALLLSGPNGVGLQTIAKELGSHFSQPEIIIPTKRTAASTTLQIGIETIRDLYERTRSKQTQKQVIVIDDADLMSLAAQNGFLKLLEEPGQQVHFILTSHHPELLLPTVRSRLQTIAVAPLDEKTTTELLAREYPTLASSKKTQLTFIAAGLPAEIERLIADDTYFAEAAKRMQLVKTILTAERYERLITLQSQTFTKPEALKLIDGALLVLQRQPTATGLARISRLLQAYERILMNGNPRLQLTTAVV